MANTLEYPKKFLPIIDEVYKKQSITEGMDAATRADFSGTNEVKVLKIGTPDWVTTPEKTAIPKVM